MSSTSASIPSATSTADEVKPHDLNPIVAFVIGFAIILAASLMNAGGLNLCKLDMVRTMALPKALRKRDWMRPLWLIGMSLYIASQLVGSTIALEFIRAEYVAPLGSSSLIFNFLFASLLVGTPVTRNDIYGTIVVIIGVVGIVAFGSINNGLVSTMDLSRLIDLWSRPGWLSYFVIFGVIPIFIVFVGASQLDAVLASRLDTRFEDAEEEPTARTPTSPGFWLQNKQRWNSSMKWTKHRIEGWSLNKSDKTLAWTLGICWACCGGALAGGTLVFAKVCVKLISGSLNHRNTGNQFVHPAAIFTFIFLALTAVLQIICLNRGLKAYDSTLVVPVFYGVYTASGFLDSLIFSDEVDSYKSWTLFLIFASIVTLIGGVVLLTLKKPEPPKEAANSTIELRRTQRENTKERDLETDDEDDISLREQGGSRKWSVGDESDSERDYQGPSKPTDPSNAQKDHRPPGLAKPESKGLMSHEDDDNEFGDFASVPPR